MKKIATRHTHIGILDAIMQEREDRIHEIVQNTTKQKVEIAKRM